MLNRAQTMGRHAEFEATLKLFADQRHVLKVGKEDTLSLVVGVANIVADLAALTGQFADPRHDISRLVVQWRAPAFTRGPNDRISRKARRIAGQGLIVN